MTVFSSPEHEVLRMSYCVVGRHLLACVCSRGHIFSLIIMKRGQNVCLDEISDELETGLCRVKN